MAKLEIVEWPAKVLETVSKEVTVFDENLQTFLKNMHETMEEANGIGLAANQVGIAQRAITIHIPFDDNGYKDQEDGQKEPWHDIAFNIINPVIVKKAGKISWQEGCLSFPEIYDFVDRSAEVWVDAQNERGETYTIHGTGLMAVCLQHEIDHIDGIVFVNRMSRLKSGIIKKKMLRRGKLSVEG